MIHYADAYVGPLECLAFVLITLIVLSPLIISVVRDTWKDRENW